MTVIDLLERPVYPYSEVDRLIGLSRGTARRWINGYERSGKSYLPILREASKDTEWATWGEFVEARILAEYRDLDIPTGRLRATVAGLRDRFGVSHPLAHERPYLAAEAGEIVIDRERLDPDGEPGLVVIRTGQMLLSERGREVITRAALTRDANGHNVVAELRVDEQFPDIVVSPDRRGGEPTITGRRIAVTTIAGLASTGEDISDIAADFGLSKQQVKAAIAYAAKYGLAA